MLLRVLTAFSVLVVLLLTAGELRADWEASKDNVFNKKQLLAYIETLKEFMEQWRAMGKSIEANKGNIGALAALAHTDAKFDALLAKHGTNRQEFEWMGTQAMMAYGLITAGEVMDKLKDQFVEQGKNAQLDLLDAQKKLSSYEAVEKGGKRVLTKEEREGLVKEATDLQQSIVDELKQRAEEAETASDEAIKAEIDAKTTAGLSKSPPADVSDNREEYVKGKLVEVETTCTAVKAAQPRKRSKEIDLEEHDSSVGRRTQGCTA